MKSSGLKFIPWQAGMWAVLLAIPCPTIRAATFTNNASIQVVNDPSQSLTSTNGIFTISCWFRISIPSSFVLSENMTILMDRADGKRV